MANEANLAQLNIFGLNEYDLQRVLRENIAVLSEKNAALLQFAKRSDVSKDMKKTYATLTQRNAAEVLYVLSVSTTQNDLQTYINTSPLFRGGAGV